MPSGAEHSFDLLSRRGSRLSAFASLHAIRRHDIGAREVASNSQAPPPDADGTSGIRRPVSSDWRRPRVTPVVLFGIGLNLLLAERALDSESWAHGRSDSGTSDTGEQRLAPPCEAPLHRRIRDPGK